MTLPTYMQQKDEKRGMTRERAAAYLDLEPAGFDGWVRKGIVPGPMEGTKRWDKKAIDAALDKRSGLSPTMPADPYEEWKRGRLHVDAS